MARRPNVHEDERGCLYEIPNVLGTTFISVTRPGITRGNHYHKEKTEWFLVLAGRAVVDTRDVGHDAITMYELCDKADAGFLQIDPLTIHSIENVGDTDLILLVQSDQIFDPNTPDTYPELV